MRGLARVPASWRHAGLWFADWLFAVPQHFIHIRWWAEASLLRTYTVYKASLEPLPVGFRSNPLLSAGSIRRQLELGERIFTRQTGTDLLTLEQRWHHLEMAKA